MKVHSKPFICVVCGARYSTKQSLNKHIVVHGDEDVVGRICDSRSQSSDFHSEEVSQSGFANGVVSRLRNCNSRLKSKMAAVDDANNRPKWYKCKSCTKRFSHKGHYEVHVRTHTGEKPFVCAWCNVKYSTKRSLERHV